MSAAMGWGSDVSWTWIDWAPSDIFTMGSRSRRAMSIVRPEPARHAVSRLREPHALTIRNPDCYESPGPASRPRRTRMRRCHSLLAVLSLMTLLPATAARAEETARQILDRAKQLDDTTRKWTDRSETLTLTIHGKSGGDRERSLQIFDKRGANDEDKSLTFFLAPSEVKGTAFLQIRHPGKEDEQLLYLPELKRSRRIVAQA